VGHGLGEHRGHLALLRGKPVPGNLHEVEEARRNLAHQLVLGLVVRAPGLAAQGGDDQHRDLEDHVEAGQGVDGIAKPAVLKHHDGALAAEPGARRDGHGVALVGGADVGQGGVVDDVVDEGLEVRAGHARPQREAVAAGLVDKRSGRDGHGLPLRTGRP
jgi:hypothetical protein